MAKKLKELEIKVTKNSNVRFTIKELNTYTYMYTLTYIKSKNNVSFLSNDYIPNASNQTHMGDGYGLSFNFATVSDPIEIKDKIKKRLNKLGYKMNDIFNNTSELLFVSRFLIKDTLIAAMISGNYRNRMIGIEKAFILFSKTKYFKDLKFIDRFINTRFDTWGSGNPNTVYQGYKDTFEAHIDKSIKKDPSTYKKYEDFLTDKLKKKWRHLKSSSDFGIFDEQLKHIIPYGLSINN